MREGVGSLATREFGLGGFPVAGKSGTAYNFTDTYFLGYSSAVTCGVWVGFDKPTKIFRGAFGKDLALPIWAKIMNSTVGGFPAKPFPMPPDVKEVEICQTSGLLATPGCRLEHKDPASGISSSQSLTYLEYATEKQIPQIRCDIHGGGVRNFAKQFDEAEWPRAAAAIDLATIRPVSVVAPTLLGFNDVYQSVRPGGGRQDDSNIPVAKAIPVNPPETEPPTAPDTAPPANPEVAEAPTPEPEVRKAEAIQPLDSPMIQLPAPPPMNF